MSQIIFAKSNNISGSPRKARLVIDMIRGKNAMSVLDALSFTNKAVASDIYKTIASAVNNAVYNFNLDKKSLVIVQAFVNEAPTYKRGRAAARGRYHQIYKRNSHIVVGLQEKAVSSEKPQAVKQIKEGKKVAKPIKQVKKINLKNKKSNHGT